MKHVSVYAIMLNRDLGKTFYSFSITIKIFSFVEKKSVLLCLVRHSRQVFQFGPIFFSISLCGNCFSSLLEQQVLIRNYIFHFLNIKKKPALLYLGNFFESQIETFHIIYIAYVFGVAQTLFCRHIEKFCKLIKINLPLTMLCLFIHDVFSFVFSWSLISEQW